MRRGGKRGGKRGSKRGGKSILKINRRQSFFGLFSNLTRGELFGDPKNSIRDSSYLVHFGSQKRGQNENKKEQKERLEGAGPKKGAKKGPKGRLSNSVAGR